MKILAKGLDSIYVWDACVLQCLVVSEQFAPMSYQMADSIKCEGFTNERCICLKCTMKVGACYE